MSRNCGELLALYANNGNDAILNEIVATLASGSGRPYKHVSAELAQKVRTRMFRLLENSQKADFHAAAWGCLASLCDPQTNLVNANIQFTAHLQSSTILRRAETALANPFSNDAYCCLQFIRQFVHNDPTRSHLVIVCPGLLDTLLNHLKSHAESNWISTENGRAMCSILTILSDLLVCSHELDRFITLRGFEVLNQAFNTLARACRYQFLIDCDQAIMTEAIWACADAMASCYTVLAAAANALIRDGCCPDHYMYDKDNIDTVTQNWYYALLYLVDSEKYRSNILVCVSKFFLYLELFVAEYHNGRMIFAAWFPTHLSVFLRCLWYADGLCSDTGIVLCKSGHYLRFVTLLVHAMRSTNTDSNHVEALGAFVDRNLRGNKLLTAEVKQLLPNLRSCGYPQCFRTSLVPGKLSSCSGCKNIWYCCGLHHYLHWSVHRKSCAPNVPDQRLSADTTTKIQRHQRREAELLTCTLPDCGLQSNNCQRGMCCFRCDAWYCSPQHMREDGPAHRCAKVAKSWRPEPNARLQHVAVHCALPECPLQPTLTAEAQFCGDCKRVSYCSKAHKEAHRAAHQELCGERIYRCAHPCCTASSLDTRLRACPDCLTTCYCSFGHQFADSLNHQPNCVEQQRECSLPGCTVSAPVHQLRKCTQCTSAVWYCSEQHQAEHLPDHAAECKTNSERCCAHPACSSAVLKFSKCSACQEARYCGEEHQHAHWKKHKILCAMYTADVEMYEQNVTMKV